MGITITSNNRVCILYFANLIIFCKLHFCKFYNILSITLDNFVLLQAKTFHNHTKKNRAFFGAILIVLFPVSPKQRSNPLSVEP